MARVDGDDLSSAPLRRHQFPVEAQEVEAFGEPGPVALLSAFAVAPEAQKVHPALDRKEQAEYLDHKTVLPFIYAGHLAKYIFTRPL
jgi:hypothetical protein